MSDNYRSGSRRRAWPEATARKRSLRYNATFQLLSFHSAWNASHSIAGVFLATSPAPGRPIATFYIDLNRPLAGNQGGDDRTIDVAEPGATVSVTAAAARPRRDRSPPDDVPVFAGVRSEFERAGLSRPPDSVAARPRPSRCWSSLWACLTIIASDCGVGHGFISVLRLAGVPFRTLAGLAVPR